MKLDDVASWVRFGRLGSLLGRLVGVKPSMPKSRSTKIKHLRHLGLLARTLCASAGCLGSSWGLVGRLASVLGMAWAFGGFLKLFWGVLGGSLGHLGDVWRVLGASWVCLRARRLGSLLGRQVYHPWPNIEWIFMPSWLVLGRHGVVKVRLGPVSWGVRSRLERSLRPELR